MHHPIPVIANTSAAHAFSATPAAQVLFVIAILIVLACLVTRRRTATSS